MSDLLRVADEAIAERDRLRAENEQLRKALETLLSDIKSFDVWLPDPALKKAQAALESTNERSGK